MSSNMNTIIGVSIAGYTHGAPSSQRDPYAWKLLRASLPG
jgi:hypothetical protein